MLLKRFQRFLFWSKLGRNINILNSLLVGKYFSLGMCRKGVASLSLSVTNGYAKGGKNCPSTSGQGQQGNDSQEGTDFPSHM